MATVLGAVLLVAVCWSFFMGFMVGRGQNPEKRVEQMTGLTPKDAPAALAKAAPAGVAPNATPEPGPEAAGQPEQAQATGQAQAAAQPQAAGAAPQKGQKNTPTQGAAAAEPATPPVSQAPAYPFSQPNGNSLAAWGIKPAQQAGQAQPGAQGSAQTASPKPTAAKTGPQFDFVYQVAAFKSAEDADKLCPRLESKGLRTKKQKSGKLVLVMVSMRGTEDDAFNLREELRHMRLGVPILVSQKAVSSKPAKKGR